MGSMFKTMIGGVVLGSLFVGGCTTDMPMFTNQRKARIEGVKLYNSGDPENAAGAFRNAVKTDPRDYRSQYYLGLTYEKLNNYQQAIQAYKSALGIMRDSLAGRDDVDFRQVVMNTLASAIRKHDDSGSEQALLKEQSSNPKLDSRLRAESSFLLAKIARMRRDADTALLSYFKGAELDPSDFWLQKEAGLYMLAMGQSKQAGKPLTRASEINSRDAEVNAGLRQLNLPLPLAAIRNENGAKPLFKSTALPAVDLKVGDSALTLPEQLPVD